MSSFKAFAEWLACAGGGVRTSLRDISGGGEMLNASTTARIVGLLLACAIVPTQVAAQERYRLSTKFHEVMFTKGQVWNGQHKAENVFCVKFPRAAQAEALAVALYNENRLYFSRVAYREQIGIYVVSSKVPEGRSADEEIEKITSNNLKSAQTHPRNFKVGSATGALGPSVVLTMRNSVEGANDAPFPFVRSFANRADGRLYSISIHHLFVHDGNRIEVAGLQYLKEPVDADKEAEVTNMLAELVAEASDSLQTCTLGLPARGASIQQQK